MAYRTPAPRAPRRPYQAPKVRLALWQYLGSIFSRFSALPHPRANQLVLALRDGFRPQHRELIQPLIDWLKALDDVRDLPIAPWPFPDGEPPSRLDEIKRAERLKSERSIVAKVRVPDDRTKRVRW